MQYKLIVSNETNSAKFYLIYLLAFRMQYENIYKLLFTVFHPSQNDITRVILGHKSFFCWLQLAQKAWNQNFTGVGPVLKKL